MAREIDTAAEAAATAALPRCHEVHCGPDGARTQLIQHVSQLNVMLKAWPKDPGAVEPKRIGFRLPADLDRSETAPV